MTCLVYLLTIGSGRLYVGVTANLSSRVSVHRTSNSVVGRAIRKHGLLGIKVLAEFDNKVDALEYEIAQIKLLNTRLPHGYNVTAGGEGMNGYSWTKDRRAQQPEVAQKSKQALARYWSNSEHREAARQRQLARCSDPDYRKNISHTQKQRYTSTEARQKLVEQGRAAWARHLEKIS